MIDVFSYKIDPFQLKSYLSVAATLEQKFANFWAGVQHPARMISYTRRFSFEQKRQELRHLTNPLDDVRELIPLLTAGDERQIQALIVKRQQSLSRAMGTLRDALRARDLLTLAASGTASGAELVALKDACIRSLWRWRWLIDYRRQYELIERAEPPLGVAHWYMTWPDGYADAEALRSVLKSAFHVQGVEQRPFVALFSGDYAPEPTYLRPLAAGQPYLRVLTAYDVRGDWNLGSFGALLNSEYELAISIDVTTLQKVNAERATTNAFNVLKEALYGKFAVKDAKSERAFQSVQYVMQHLDMQALHEVAYAVLVRAPNLRALDRTTQAIRDQLGARLRLDVVPGLQHEYLKLFTATPAREINAPLIRRNALSEHVAAKVPWGIRKTENTKGILIGYDVFEGMHIHFDFVGDTGTDNGHFMMLGVPGSGKTVALCTLALRLAVEGYQVIFLDPMAKIPWLCEAVGGGAQCNDVTTDGAINCLDPVSEDIDDQLKSVLRKLTIILGRVHEEAGSVTYTPRDFSNYEEGAIDRALNDERVYGAKGHKLVGMTPAAAPILSDLCDALETVTLRTHPGIGPALAEEIRLKAEGSLAHIYNARTVVKWDFSSDVCGFNFKDADKQMLPLFYDHCLSQLDRYVRSEERKRRKQPLMVIIDEMGYMSQIKSLEAFIAFATKTWRNYMACMGSGDQNAQMYMAGSDFSKLTSDITAIKFIGKQEGHDVELIRRAYGHLLTDDDIEAIRTSQAGEFVVIFKNEVHRLKIELTSEERPYFVRRNKA